MAALPPLREGCVSVHQQQLTNPALYCRSILPYPLDWELRADLLETELVMIRLVDLAIFEEPGDDGVGLTPQGRPKPAVDARGRPPTVLVTIHQ